MNSPGHRRISPLCSFLSPVSGCKRMFCLLGRLGSSLFSPLTSPHAASGFRLGEHGSGQWPHQISFIVCQLNLGKIAARFNSSERHNLAVKSVIQSFGSTRERGLLRRRSGAIKQLSSHPWRPYLERLEFRVSLRPCYREEEKHSVWSVMWVVGRN